VSQLFRNEAIDAKRDQWLGRIVLIRPTSFGFLTMLGLVCALGVVLFLCFGQYTKRAHVQGLLVPDKGLIKVVAPAQSVVVERRVHEGQVVSAGDVLFVLTLERQLSTTVDSDTARAPVNANEAILGTLQVRKQSLVDEQGSQAQLTEKQHEQLATRVHGMEAEGAKVDQQIATQRERLASAQRQIKRMRELVAQNFYSESALQQKQDELLDQRARIQALEQTRLQMTRETSSVRSELDQLKLKAGRDKQQLSRAVAEIDQAGISAESQRRIMVTAPADGTVSAVMAEPGMAVGTQPLLTLLPTNAELEAQLYAPSNAAGFVQPGQKVLMRYAAFPYQKFGQYEGQVQSVSRSAISPQEMQEVVTNSGQPTRGEGLYRIRVKLVSQDVSIYGKPQRLSAGMQIEADILQDTRRLVEWVFEPVLSLKGSL
jgi:membrane fusion protein